MNAAPTQADIDLTTTWAGFYAARGFHPLPSRLDKKQPLVRYSHLWESPPDPGLFKRHPTTNIQVMTGRRWRLLVIDLDGPEAAEHFATLGQCPRTWTTHSGGNGKHLWFRLPENYRRELPKAFLWRPGTEHTAVERLCDRSLIMAPPSIHPKTGERYRFASKGESPARLPLPAPCPQWVLDLKPLVAERPEYTPTVRMAPRPVVAGRFSSTEVLDAIVDKVGLATEFGLRIPSRRSASSGWIPCHAIGREDRNPSAQIHVESGTYSEPGSNFHLRFFDLLACLGNHANWQDACNEMGERFVGTNRSRTA